MESIVTDKAYVDVSYVTVLLKVINYDINTKTRTFSLFLKLRD